MVLSDLNASLMANGVESLKRIAELIAPRNTEGGVGEIILKYVLKEEMP